MKDQIKIVRQAAALLAVFSTLLFVLAGLPASAATSTWNGGGTPDGNWATPGNWNGVVPATNSLLIFTGATQTATTNNFVAGTPFNNIVFNSGASAFTLRGNAMVLSSPTDAGSGQITGGSIVNSSANAETSRLAITLALGNHTINGGAGSGLKLNGTLTRSNGAVVTMSGNINATGALSVSGDANGILGGWAIFNNNWATLDGSSNIVAYSAYTDVAGGGTIASNPAANVRIPVNGAAISITTPTTRINSLLFGSPTASTAAQTVTMGAGNKLVLGQDGGVFNNTAVAGAGTYRNLLIGASSATGGILTAGDGIHPATITFGSAPLPSASGFCTVHASIQDNGSAPVTVVVAGAYVGFNGNTTFATMTTNSYSGGTYILQGRVSQPNPYTFGYGPVYIVSGGQANMGCQVTNDFYIEGSGTVENQGMGVLRLYRAAVGLFVGNLTGTIHLTGVANVCSDNITDPALGAYQIGFAGKITGPGSLGIGSPTATTRSGIINIGPTNGIGAFTNDYAGDTRINGINGGTVSSTLRIGNPANNNIMPHGTNGSYAGGKTGNLILNGVNASRRAFFDLNGSTQTINGLVSTATSPADDLVQDTGAGNGALIVGDSDAISTFAGSIQNSINITKIGAGTLTLSGANSYNGNTAVNAGRLITTTASTGAGNYSVAGSAALGVTTATLGGTLQVNNLTFGASSSLQLSSGTLGNPSAAIVNVNGALTLNGTVTVSLSGVGLTAGGPFTVMTYAPGSRVGGGSFTLVNSPRIVATLNDDTINGIVTITILSADSAVKWKGGSLGQWDINNTTNTIWQTVPSGSTTYYIEAGSGNDAALFDDTLTGTSNVTLTATLAPQAVTVSNSTANYTFSGSGKLTGTAGLTKQGAGTLTIANLGNNDFSGDIALTAGTLVISNSSSIPNTVSGSGALVKNGNGTLTLSGNNVSFTGPVTVNAGTLVVPNGAALATASSTTIANGATLDISLNSVELGPEPIAASGSGVGGNGAIVNSSGHSGGAIATSFQNLTLAGDTSIGGPGRLDFRSSDIISGSDATLSTTGHAYKLTKLSGSILQLSSVQIDNALGDIDVQAGTLSFQGNMPSLGNPANTLTVFGGATLQFINVGNTMSKALVLKDGAVVNNNAGANTYGSAVNLQGIALFNVAGSSLTFNDVLSGTGGLSKVTGTAPLTLMASNTYTGNTLINAGVLTLTEPGDIRASQAITLSSGGTLDVSGRADQTMTLLSGHSLAGRGTINGNLVAPAGSTVAPGADVGTVGQLNVNGSVTLGGATVMRLNKTTATSDSLSASAITFGGTLVLTNVTGTLAPGDSFTLFSAGGTGAFTSIVPATPGSKLAWDTNNLSSSGVLGVTGPPSITNFVVSGSSVTLQGGFGTAFGQYTVVTTTNVTRPANQWTPLATNFFDGSGNFEFTTNITTLPQQYFMLRVP